MTIYDVGDKVTVPTTVTVGGAPTDDPATTFVVTAPDNSATAPAAPTHGGTGQYSTVVATTLPGNYLVRFNSPTVGVVDEQQFYVQPPGFRVVSLTDAKNHINKTSTFTGDDNELRGFIDTAGELCDHLAGPTINRTVVEYHSGPKQELYLAVWPVVSVTSVAETWPGGPTYNLTQESALGVGGTGYDFTFNPVTGSITRRVNAWGYMFPPGVDNIKVTYVAGRAQPWPATVRLAALEEIAFLWRTSQTGRGAGRPGGTGSAVDETVQVAGFGAVPIRVLEMLGGKKPPQAGA